MHKLLFESGIDNTTVVAFNAIYTNMSSVYYMGKYSDWFHIRQGTRQGGKALPTIYQWSNSSNREKWPWYVYVRYVCWLADRRRRYGGVVVLF